MAFDGITIANIVSELRQALSIAYEDFTESNVCVKYNKELAAEYMLYLNRMAEDELILVQCLLLHAENLRISGQGGHTDIIFQRKVLRHITLRSVHPRSLRSINRSCGTR